MQSPQLELLDDLNEDTEMNLFLYSLVELHPYCSLYVRDAKCRLSTCYRLPKNNFGSYHLLLRVKSGISLIIFDICRLLRCIISDKRKWQRLKCHLWSSLENNRSIRSRYHYYLKRLKSFFCGKIQNSDLALKSQPWKEHWSFLVAQTD